MTQIDFHLHVANKQEYACRLLRKAVARVPVVVVAGEAQILSQLEQQLWQLSDTAFIGHAWIHQNNSTPTELSMQHCARVLFCTTTLPRAIDKAVLLNMGAEIAEGFEQYSRLIEIVSNDANDKELARVRWRHYKQRGYPIEQHKQTSN